MVSHLKDLTVAVFSFPEIQEYDKLNASIMEYCISVPGSLTESPKCDELCLARSPS